MIINDKFLLLQKSIKQHYYSNTDAVFLDK